ncbi:hypothetical protein C7974DRAFT_323396 [Boeremia exigua]|uniref:uncharacterized protein n=1 Tax=Boeremia exigua TaxID=749465 RepID=UPI001E8DEE9F|nr:uncharacterized protein C7974DRAFT_323396 [Boeremia exigua]KAH6612093.1 hypothetical protein C7974DRAFT_323396 [Boeremia exigua]
MYIRPGFVVVITGCVLTGLSTLVVALRYYCRYYLIGAVTATDHLMFVALVLTWANLVVNYFQDQTSSHIRPSFYRIPEKRPLVEGYVKGVMITWWLYRAVYVAALCFVKLSILYFFRTIASHRNQRRVINGTIIFVSVYSFGAVAAAVFQCRKPSDAWNTEVYLAQFDTVPNPNTPKVQCYDPTILFIVTAALNLFSDVVILLIPIPILLSLGVPLRQRLALVGIFSVGVLAIVASSIRMRVMTLWAESPWNSAIYGTDLLLWGQVEINSGIISASIPFLRLLFKRRERTERAASGRKVAEIERPRVGRKPQIEPLEMETIALFPRGGDGGEGEKEWKPFMTVPASMGERTWGSTATLPTSPRTMA